MNSFSIAHSTYYDVLDIKPDATVQEVRDAYLRAKSAYTRDSVALYSLIGPEEREEAIRNIEEAYIVLSDTERRRDYDKNHGLLSIEEAFFRVDPKSLKKPLPGHPNPKVVSIDRVPPMEGGPMEDMLVPPSTDFTRRADDPKLFKRPGDLPTPQMPILPETEISKTTSLKSSQAAPRAQSPGPAFDLSGERDWHGTTLRRVREALKITVDEIAVSTKISKSYIHAIEDESFSKLPAGVYVRGFLTQICRMLKLPIDRVTNSYMVRYYQSRPDQAR
ncbi:MAG: helix-turn-helix domain-containing protein [Bdellovibrionota bacterium]